MIPNECEREFRYKYLEILLKKKDKLKGDDLQKLLIEMMDDLKKVLPLSEYVFMEMHGLIAKDLTIKENKIREIECEVKSTKKGKKFVIPKLDLEKLQRNCDDDL